MKSKDKGIISQGKKEKEFWKKQILCRKVERFKRERRGKKNNKTNWGTVSNLGRL